MAAEYVICRWQRPEAAPEFYMGKGQWTTDEKAAQGYDGSTASVYCENLQMKSHAEFSFRLRHGG